MTLSFHPIPPSFHSSLLSLLPLRSSKSSPWDTARRIYRIGATLVRFHHCPPLQKKRGRKKRTKKKNNKLCSVQDSCVFSTAPLAIPALHKQVCLLVHRRKRVCRCLMCAVCPWFVLHLPRAGAVPWLPVLPKGHPSNGLGRGARKKAQMPLWR